MSHLTGNRLAGGVAGVVYGDELAWSAGAGFADQAARKASDPAMLYAIASITKTFTGTAIMQLRDAGRLDLDDPAVAWLPELRQAASPFGPIETVTLRRMRSHEPGLPAEPTLGAAGPGRNAVKTSLTERGTTGTICSL
ncbi:MAG: serine hydrolase domain-containing protein [Streptosporangiaceae bacterium]